MKLDPPKSPNYAAVVVRINTVVKLPGLDNLVGVPVLGYQALTQNDKEKGELAIAFTAETQLSDKFCHMNNLYRDSAQNVCVTEKGYLEANRRIRALKLRGHVSNALLMPLDSVQFAINPGDLNEGDTFDTLGQFEICRKYVVPVKPVNNPAKSKVERAFKRVTDKQLPMHIDTDNYWRNKHLLKPGVEVIASQKLHGSSIRVGNVPVLRELSWKDRFAKRLGVRVVEHEHDVVYGSRKVIKDESNAAQGYYASDIWVEYGKRIAELIPEGYVLYGELIGWTPDGTAIQKGYTYHLPQGEMELYVYRVACVNRLGNMADLSWDGVKAFCTARGLKWTPELARLNPASVDDLIDEVMDTRLADQGGWIEPPLVVSSHKTVDEGLVIRQDGGMVPTLLKAKSPIFLEHETKLLDAEVIDIESQEAA